LTHLFTPSYKVWWAWGGSWYRHGYSWCTLPTASTLWLCSWICTQSRDNNLWPWTSNNGVSRKWRMELYCPQSMFA